jgi:hypothetical protein
MNLSWPGKFFDADIASPQQRQPNGAGTTCAQVYRCLTQ